MMMDLGEILKDLYQSTVSSGRESPSQASTYPTVFPGDQEAVSVIEPDLAQGPWIAGGAALRWYQRQPVVDSDIDVFCRTAAQAMETIEKIKSYNRYQIKHESENAVTISYHKNDDWAESWNLQVIRKKFYPDIRSVIDDFDITVCQIATTGTEWVLGPSTAQDVRAKTLRFTDHPGPDAVKRLAKYWIYGYRPVPGTIERLINDPMMRWDFRNDEPYSGF